MQHTSLIGAPYNHQSTLGAIVGQSDLGAKTGRYGAVKAAIKSH